MPILHFDEQQHEYTLDDIWVPGVTSCINDISEDLLFSSAFRRKNAIGKAVHKLAEEFNLALIAGGPAFNLARLNDCDPDVASHFRGYLKFMKERDFQIEAAEAKVFSIRYMYAGTMDIVAIDDKPRPRRAIVDIKCVAALQPTTALQLAAYKKGWNERNPDKLAIRRYALQLFPDGYFLKEYIEKTDFDVFHAKLTSYQWDKKHGLK